MSGPAYPENQIDYEAYRIAASPSWMLGPFGQAWSAAFGQTENQILDSTIDGVQARFPMFAPLDSNGVSQALGLIGQDRQLLPTFDDNDNLDGYRTWLQSAFTPEALTSPTPVNPLAPGFYYGGTRTGFNAALINSGFYTYDGLGNFIGPNYYRNIDFAIITNNDPVTWVGAAEEYVEIAGYVTTAGTPGAQDSGVVQVTIGSIPSWTANTAYEIADYVQDVNGNAYYCIVPGTSGSSTPTGFVASPTPSTWPPTAGTGITDGPTVQWVYATFSPIPLVVPFGSYGINFGTEELSIGTYQVSYTPQPPDGRTDAWARIWLVLPISNLLKAPYKWGNELPDVDYEYHGYWGRKPKTDSKTEVPPSAWGAAGSTTTGPNVYGMIASLGRTWLPGHVRLVGAWGVYGSDTSLDSVPLPPWNEMFSTINGLTVPFFRFQTGVQAGF